MAIQYGTVPADPAAKPSRRPAMLYGAVATAALAVLVVVACLGFMTPKQDAPAELLTQDLVLFKMEPPPEPWSPPANLWMYWGGSPNKRFGHSGDNLRHLVKLGRLAGGEYRDPHFLFTYEAQTFRDLSEACCTTMLVAPMKNNMPIWNAQSNVAQRLRNYVANGNHMIFTGGSLVSMEFINRYFYYNMEPIDAQGIFKGSGYGNWSPGPFRKLIDDDLPWQYKLTPDTLYQDHISVTSMGLRSLPSGTTVLYMTPKSSPVFMIKFCQRISERHGEPPIKTVPRDCWRHAARGYPCSCGTITYIGYDWHMDQTAADWDKVMLAAVEYQQDPDVSETFSPNCKQPPKVVEDPHAPHAPPICK
mmetsp:Transcript_62507/g.146954  ORF Transcript_62507/g.146954 Transcript_62507/m.146954 type:complete len:361 (+) Transcript_62507:27-1109(+)